MATKSGTWGRAGNHRRVRVCPVCKSNLQTDERYRWDTRTLIVWHTACEASPRFARLLERIAATPTYTPTFPKVEAK